MSAQVVAEVPGLGLRCVAPGEVLNSGSHTTQHPLARGDH